MDGIFGYKILPDIVLGVAASVVVIIFAGGLYSKRRGSTAEFPKSHWALHTKGFLRNVSRYCNLLKIVPIVQIWQIAVFALDDLELFLLKVFQLSAHQGLGLCST